MGYDKGHQEFHGVDMKAGFHTVPGYPWGFSEKILAGSLDEKNKVAYVYRPGAEVQVLKHATTLDASPELPGFILDLTPIWA